VLPEVITQSDETHEPPVARLAGYEDAVPVWQREQLCQGQIITGPALITETVATTWLPAGWNCQVDQVGNLQLERI
jgi:N-methylhydantoinase A